MRAFRRLIAGLAALAGIGATPAAPKPAAPATHHAPPAPSHSRTPMGLDVAWWRRTVRVHQYRVRSRRVTQVRYRVSKPPKPGGDGRLDAGLRRLAMGLRGRAAWAMPDIYAAWNYGGELGVLLTGPCVDPPEPYTARSPDTWSLPGDAPAAEVDGVPALLPGLLTLGTWPEGGELYVDSERTGLLTLTGDAERCDNLLRHLAAEAATAAWADSACVLICGFGSADSRALGSLSEGRVRAVASVPDALSRMARRAVANRAVLAENETADTMAARVNSTTGSLRTTYLLFVADPWGEHTAQLEDLDAQLAAAGRIGVCVVATHPASTRWSAGVSSSGGLDMPWLAFSDTFACQLTSDQLAALSAAVGDPAYARVPETEGRFLSGRGG